MRVAIYARVSTEAQEARGTIGSQLAALRAKVAAGGDELVGEFIDDGYSGARLDRPGLDALRDAAEAGIIETVWCLSPDRLARAYAYQVLILDEFARHRVPVCFSDSPPLDDPQGRLLVQVQGIIAEYERAKISERQRRGKMFRSRAGEVIANKVPYGYRRVPRSTDRAAQVIIHDAEAAVVRRIFADFVGGSSIRRIAIALNAEAIPSPGGKPTWPPNTVGRLLHNEAYVGRLFWNRVQTSYDHQLGRNRQTQRPRTEWVTIPIPAIISEDTYDTARRQAPTNSHFSSRRTEPDTFLPRRLLRCGRCGIKLAAHRANRDNGTAQYYYACRYRDPVCAGGADRICTQRRIRADQLDTFVFDQVAQLLARPELLAAGEASVAGGTPAPDDELVAAQLDRIDRRIDATGSERRRLADLYQAGVIDQTEMARRAAELEGRRTHLEQQRRTLTEQRSELAQQNRLSQHIAAFAQRALAGLATMDFEQRQQLLRLVVEDIRIDGWRLELRPRIPLDQHPPDTSQNTPIHRQDRSPRGTKTPKEAVSSKDRLRSTGANVGLVDVTAVPDTMAARSGGVDQRRREADHPPVHADMVDLDAPLGPGAPHVAVRQPEAQVPPDSQQDHLGWKAVAGEG